VAALTASIAVFWSRIAREHEAHGVGCEAFGFLKKLDPLDPRHLHVRNDHRVRAFLLHDGESLLAAEREYRSRSLSAGCAGSRREYWRRHPRKGPWCSWGKCAGEFRCHASRSVERSAPDAPEIIGVRERARDAPSPATAPWAKKHCRRGRGERGEGRWPGPGLAGDVADGFDHRHGQPPQAEQVAPPTWA